MSFKFKFLILAKYNSLLENNLFIFKNYFFNFYNSLYQSELSFLKNIFLNNFINKSSILDFIDFHSFNNFKDYDLLLNKIQSIKYYVNLLYSESFINSFNFDSYMIDTNDLILGEKRLLETDVPLILPTKTHIRLLVTSDDVLHCFAIPRFGLKIDAVPGRLNEAHIFIKDPGVYYGQCSEICGVNHGFMPIQVIAVEPSTFH